MIGIKNEVGEFVKRIALIIGNDNYDDPNFRLQCAVNDAESLANSLNELQFDTLVYHDLENRGFSEAMTEFSRKLENYDVGLFFLQDMGFRLKEIII